MVQNARQTCSILCHSSFYLSTFNSFLLLLRCTTMTVSSRSFLCHFNVVGHGHERGAHPLVSLAVGLSIALSLSSHCCCLVVIIVIIIMVIIIISSLSHHHHRCLVVVVLVTSSHHSCHLVISSHCCCHHRHLVVIMQFQEGMNTFCLGFLFLLFISFVCHKSNFLSLCSTWRQKKQQPSFRSLWQWTFVSSCCCSILLIESSQ